MSLESEIRKIITPKIINENKDCDICGDGIPCTCGESQEQIGESKPESLDKTLEDLFQEGQIGEFDHLEEGYEAEVKKVLDKKGIDAYFKNGMLMISKRDMNDAVKILKKQDFDMPKVKAEDVSAYTKDIQQHPKLKAAHSDKMQKIKEEEEMQEDKRFGLSQSLVDAVAKIIGGEKPEAMNPAQQAAIAIAKKKKGEKPKDEKDEGNAFGKAVLAAKEAGKKDFIFSGKKYVVKDELDKVNPKAAAKKFDDRKDKDIDNDGDVDSSDKYLHKKRKAIGKAIAKDKKEQKPSGKKEPVDTKPKMAEEVEVEEGMLKVSDFDGKKHAEKAGLKVKMGASSPFGGASATLSGPDDKVIKYAVQHLGGSGKTLKDVQKSLNEAINLDDADRDAQQYSNGSMSVKKIPSMIKKRSDKHLHLHMKSYHKEKDGEAFAKKHGYKVSNYVKTPAGSRMNLYKEDVQKSLNEAKMTDAQMKKREEIVMSLKKRMSEFEDKYGDKAKDVMYATATKMAMKSA